MEENKIAKPEKVIPSLCEGYLLGDKIVEYTSRDAILYALAVGFSQDPLDEKDMNFTYENSDNFSVVPSFGVLMMQVDTMFYGLQDCPGMPEFMPMMLLHGEHKIMIFQEIEKENKLRVITRIRNVYDKGTGALILIQIEAFDTHKNELQFLNEASLFIRGLGGFNGSSGPAPSSSILKIVIPDRKPDFLFTFKTTENQALLYRLCGDRNPLHVDPQMAALGGFERPILHGLCTFGIATHGIIRELAGNISSKISSIEGRFSSPVFPGQTLQTEIYKTSKDGTFLFQVRILETEKICFSNGVTVISNDTKSRL